MGGNNIERRNENTTTASSTNRSSEENNNSPRTPNQRRRRILIVSSSDRLRFGDNAGTPNSNTSSSSTRTARRSQRLASNNSTRTESDSRRASRRNNVSRVRLMLNIYNSSAPSTQIENIDDLGDFLRSLRSSRATIRSFRGSGRSSRNGGRSGRVVPLTSLLEMLMLSSEPEHRGADESTIEALPSEIIQEHDSLTSTIPNESNREKCAICLECFQVGEKVRRLPCSHVYHQACVDRWLRSNASCPVCKHAIQS